MNSESLGEFGKRLIIGVSGPQLNDTDKRLLESVRPGGILLLKRNLVQDQPYESWFATFKDLIAELYSHTGREDLIVSIDHEGGKVQRTPAPITNFGAPCAYVKEAAAVGRAMALELASLGINLSWAPLCDINTNAENPIIGKLGRSFGNTPQIVAAAASAFHEALMKQGILTCAKHFPGHGDTWSDSHLELPTVETDEITLRSRELVPFQALVEAGVPTIMTAHVHFPKIDGKNPATLSHHIISDILRRDLGFNGVVIADDVNMKAVADKFQSPAGVTQALSAGVDMFIVGRYPDADADLTPIALCEYMQQAAKKGLINKQTLEESSKRMEALFASVKRHLPKKLEASTFEKHAALASTITVV
ncbi:MAG: beta-N-acetylhexosaminidase [Deltaproteobacteria bacterium]|nr:beta-N-acetylhexosaminidase [Deltaproteobacteria bacterium]